MSDQAMKIKCPACGADCPPEAKFCKNCGVFLTAVEENQEKEKEQEQKKEKESQDERDSARIEKQARSVTITLKPPIIALGAAVILLIAVAAFIIGNRKSEEGHTAVQPEVHDNSSEQTAQEDQMEPEEEVDMSLVDIDAVSNEYVELSGRVISNGYELLLQMEAPLNFYVFNPQQSKNILVQGIDRSYLASDSTLSMSKYEGRTVTAGGEVRLDNGNIVFKADSLIYAEPEQDDPGIHQYQIVIEDCTWHDAFTRSSTQGGYLARISSPEEYQYIVDMLNSREYTNIHFYLGGRRDETGDEYYWVNEQNEFMGECLNSSDSWCSSYWYQNEPSFRDTGADAIEEIEENVMNLFYVSGSWYLNDSSDNLSGNYPNLLSGKVGYIIEYEE